MGWLFIGRGQQEELVETESVKGIRLYEGLE